MAKTKAQKAETISKLEDAFKNAVSTVFVHFSGLSVADESALRRSLRAEGVSYFVAKKTLIRIALDKLGHKGAEMPLEGEVAIAYGGGEDATKAARLIHDAGKKLADKLSILGGLFESKLVSEATMREIATIPSLDALRGMFAQVINSPRQRFAVVLSAVAEKRAQE